MLCLLDKSVLVRIERSPSVLDALLPRIGQLAVSTTTMLEAHWSAKSPAHYARMQQEFSHYARLPVGETAIDLALEIQGRLIPRGHHRGPGIADLILAATAVTYGVDLLHYDSDFDLIRDVEPRLRSNWIVARGSID